MFRLQVTHILICMLTYKKADCLFDHEWWQFKALARILSNFKSKLSNIFVNLHDNVLSYLAYQHT